MPTQLSQTDDAFLSLVAQYPSIPREALFVYYQEWSTSDSATAGWAAVRQDSRYDDWFPGNTTNEGEVRYAEPNYAVARESYRDVFRSVGIYDPTGIFEDAITAMMVGESSPDEFAARVKEVSDKVLSASDQLKQYYADNYGLTGITTAELMAGALDSSIGNEILSGQLTAAQIGGEAAESGYDLSLSRVEELVSFGMDQVRANTLFQSAETMVPILATLMRRHNDPDDTFDIESFIQADFFADPEENLRMRRVLAEERASFGRGTGVQRNDSGASTGLLAR